MSNLFSLNFPLPMAKEDMNNPIERITQDTRELPIRENSSTTKPPSNENPRSALQAQGSGVLDEQINAGVRQAIEEWRGSREQRQKVKQRHLVWLRKQEGAKLVWTRVGYEQLEQEIASDVSADFENVTWQSQTSREAEALELELENQQRDCWDEDSCLAFEYLVDTQEQVEQTGLTHIEVDVEGHDRNGHRLRVQRMLEVRVSSKAQKGWDGALGWKNKMQLEWTLILKKPHPFALPPHAARCKGPHQLILEQLAQHELDEAIEERKKFLRRTLENGVDGFPGGENTFGAHDWAFRTPVVQIRGPDGVVLRLAESRTDAEVDGEVIRTRRMSLTEIIPSGGQSHLFDLPTEGTEAERRVRQARWSISAAIDRCNALGSAERFVMDKWVDGSF